MDVFSDKKVLFITYTFPPIGGSGIQRNLKYVKYLPFFGWKPYVLTVKMINFYVYDTALLSEVPPETVISRTGSLDPLRLSTFLLPGFRFRAKNKGPEKNPFFSEGSKFVQIYRRIVRDFLAIPDAQIGWIPFAYVRGLQLIRKHKLNIIFASANRLSATVVAYLLSRTTGLPYVLDFPDGWTDDPYLICPTRVHKRLHAALEKVIVGNAAAVSVYGEYLAGQYRKRYPWIADHVHVLPNGFDPDDFKTIEAVERDRAKKRIVYMGSLYEHHEGNFVVLLECLKNLPGAIREDLEVLFVGQHYEKAPNQVASAHLEKNVTFLGYISHAKALGYLASADASLLFVRAGDVSSVTGKVFEYLMTGVPIIACIETKGICADILAKAGRDQYIVPPDDPNKLVQTIVTMANQNWPRPMGSGWEQFSRRHNTERLGLILDAHRR
jgi:glycosyltransferase involved in cell wall biosynthesis